MSNITSSGATKLSESRLKVFSALIGVTSLAIFLQAITAGEFVSQKHRGAWISAHDVIADIVAVLALGTMIFAIASLRRAARVLVVGTVVLFILVVVQIFIGHEISDSHQNWLIGVHVPLAFIVFGIAVWLPIQSAAQRRALTRSA